ncbi:MULTISPECIES: type IV secretory system conjugative DNA transfer family protein [unclassified Streptomyces]|uniref:type IV secretory system conjugative DNA transfer family protein n=1 Tax=unclassified Streptomyces TaxID=2593676 RepID=UPI002251BE1E|nr:MULTISPECIES: TraM recognition domain-containing protein [unclassified Streptomyces]MCX4527037.1 TraM recognition domain-containing protein [Streptomyces sp. NBC_01551]MCX4542403.1 TraM recognition domain-containing protein [Streptomyces sp. NBC_01565]
MAPEQQKKPRADNDWTTEIVLLVVGVLALLCGAWLAARLGASFADEPEPPGNPFSFAIALAKGDYGWPGGAASAIAAAEVLLLAGLVTAGYRIIQRMRNKPEVDRAARHMAGGSDLGKLTMKGAAATAERLGVRGQVPGVFIGRSLRGRQPLYGSFEDMHVDIWGPRTGKTTRRAIPAILDAPGAVLVTSNKRDIVDATRGPRQARGQVWVFDPQQVAQEPTAWWWNPLSYVTDVAKARKLADHFASGSRDADASTDAFFDPAGQDLLANLLLAAACAKAPITQIYGWLANPKDDTPERILRGAGHHMPADALSGVITAPDKQRSGIYGVAQQMASCLINPEVNKWVTPLGPADDRPELDPAEFVRSGNTLYSLSREGSDSAGPLVTALTVAVVEAAEEYATTQRGGRLPLPMVGVLDEAANVCRWRALPDLYSHYGSRGIILMTILQSWAQGVEVWGDRGMEKLWSAANVRVYGGGVSDTRFLGDLSELAGEYELRDYSATQEAEFGGWSGNRTVNESVRRERVLQVSDLGSMPPGRALVLASGTKPVLVETIPWWEGPYAQQVKASLAKHDPGAA